MTQREIVTFSIGKPKTVVYDETKEMVTGICKEQIEEAFLSKDGFHGDGVADLRFHGGPDRAVCVYPFEHYAQWEEEFEQKLPRSTFGENLTVANMLENEVYVGDIYQVGEAVIQVTQGRVPCSTINKRTGLPLIMKRMIDTGYTGYLCRVLTEGTVKSDSTITLVEQHPEKISIAYCNEIYFRGQKDVDAMKRIAAVEALAEEWRKSLQKRIDKWELVKG
ncbi:MOSC domain-containing protein YiiM [Sporosarcina luteola]|nr:MOSC domain-containing protein YiiM [Sporosarcina luteola]